MKEPVDNKLISKIRQVFDDFEDPTADAGWQELRKKYPQRNRRPLILWISSAAAVFILATGLWFVNQTGQTSANKPGKEDRALAKSEKAPKVNSTIVVKKENLKQETLTGIHEDKTVYGKNYRKQSPNNFLKPLQIKEAGTSDTLINQQVIPAETILAIELPKDILPSKAVSLVLKNEDGFILTAINPVEKLTYISKFNPEPTEADKKDEKKTNTKKEKLAYSVFAGSYFNYAEGSENQMNFGAGFTSDFRLSKNLKLSTGLSIASNSLSYKGGQDFPESASLSLNSAGYLSSGNLTTITSYNASLLTLDIPVNIKYQIIPESDKIYVSAGLSSGTYLNEKYAYQFRNFNPATGIYVAKVQDQAIKKQLNDFDLGRTLNLSLGFGTGFGKTQTISIEPFLKYPLGGLGSENLKFGSTGINLKLRFNPKKK